MRQKLASSLVILMLLGMLGCTMDDEDTMAEEAAQNAQGGNRPTLNLTVCFEGKPCPQ